MARKSKQEKAGKEAPLRVLWNASSPDDVLRMAAANGDQAAAIELNRRRAEAAAWEQVA